MNDEDNKNLNTEENSQEELPVEQAGLLESGDEATEKSFDSAQDGDESPAEPVTEEDTEEQPAEEVTEATSEDDTTETAETEAPAEETPAQEAAESFDSAQDGDESPDAPPATEEVAQDNDDPNAKWYVVHTYSGHENKVAATLKQRVESEHLEDKIFQVLVPMQDKIEIKGGKKAEVKEKIFPGYILVKMVLEDNTWLVVRTTQGVTSFVGMGNKPTAIPNSEVQSIIKFTQIQQPTFKQVFTASDTVKIVDGPFAEFIGKVDNVDEEKGKVKVLVSIFGRETPVELDFLQVQKI